MTENGNLNTIFHCSILHNASAEDRSTSDYTRGYTEETSRVG